MDSTAPTKSEYPESKISELVEKVISLAMQHQGKWIILDKSHGVNRDEIMRRVREVIRLMNIRHAVPAPHYVHGEQKEFYKIKIVTDAQYEEWKKEKISNGPFSIRYGHREPRWDETL